MKIEQIWAEIETEATAGNKTGWISRFSLPVPKQPLLIAFDADKRERALLLPLPQAEIPPRRLWPQCTGLEIFAVTVSGQACLGIRLKDSSAKDVFASLAEDLAPRVADAANPSEAVSRLVGRLHRWQKFLSAGTGGLDAAHQRALYGELHTLVARLIPVIGASAVLGWHAPKASHQDFQFSTAAIEVKTTSAKQPHSVRITSERQLDTAGINALFLHIVVVDERDVADQQSNQGDSLPLVVERIRVLLKNTPRELEEFEEGLLDAKYLASDAAKYSSRRYTLRSELTFRVTETFPRIVERMLPNGVGDVAYDLAVAACKPFAVEWGVVEQLLMQNAST